MSDNDNELYLSYLSKVILLKIILGTYLVLEKQRYHFVDHVVFFIMLFGDNFIQKMSCLGFERNCATM